MRLILISHLLSLGTAGQIHPASEPAARPEGDGAARRGLPLLQAHAGQRPTRHPADGDVNCEEKSITYHWVIGDKTIVKVLKYSFLGEVKMLRCLGRLTIFEERLFYFEREHESMFQNIVIFE